MVAEEISVNGEKYVLSRVAARLTKYSNDYIGELCRSGKVTAKQVGKLWYVEKNSLLSYQKENGKQGFGAQKIMAAKKASRQKAMASIEGDTGFLPPLEKREKINAPQITNTSSGEKFISGRVAARLTKYSNDYIGELCRSGKVTAKQVGKLWYVEKNSLLSYQKENGKQGFGAQKIMAAKKLLDKKNNDATVQTSFAAKKIISPFRFRGLEPKMIALTVALLVPLTSYLVVTGGIPITERPLGRDAVSEVARSKFASALTLSSAYDGFTGVFRKAGDALSSFFFGDMLVPPTIIVKQDESRGTKEKVTAF